nr:hypothetical protein [Conexibacter sp. W3-3-2]
MRALIRRPARRAPPLDLTHQVVGVLQRAELVRGDRVLRARRQRARGHAGHEVLGEHVQAAGQLVGHALVHGDEALVVDADEVHGLGGDVAAGREREQDDEQPDQAARDLADGTALLGLLDLHARRARLALLHRGGRGGGDRRLARRGRGVAQRGLHVGDGRGGVAQPGRLVVGGAGERDLLEAEQDDGDVVAAARGVGGVDQRPARVGQRPGRGDDLADATLGHHRRQAVGAQQVHVARAGAPGEPVDLDRRLGPERPGDDRPLRVDVRLLGRELALADELVDERVVARQPLEAAVPQQVQAAVADVRDRQLLLADVRGGDRRAHARTVLVGARELVDLGVGVLDERGEALLDAALALGQAGLEHGDRHPRGDLAGLRAAHAVGDREQGRPRERGVLVGPAGTAGVGVLEVVGDAKHEKGSSGPYPSR